MLVRDLSYSIIYLDKDIVGGEVNKHRELSGLCKHPMFLQSMTIWHHIAVMHITCVGFDSAICATTNYTNIFNSLIEEIIVKQL